MYTTLGFPPQTVQGVYSYVIVMFFVEEMTQSITLQCLIKQHQVNCCDAVISEFCLWQHVPIIVQGDIEDNDTGLVEFGETYRK